MICKPRDYRPEDFDKLHEIDQRCYEPEIAYTRRELRQYMRFPGAECVVAEVDGEVGGFCLAACEEKLGYIVTMDVLPEFRRYRVGSAVLGEIEKRLSAKQVNEIWLETATDNSVAIAFWQKHGYRKQGVRKGYYPGGRDAYAMRKSLSKPTRRSPRNLDRKPPTVLN